MIASLKSHAPVSITGTPIYGAQAIRMAKHAKKNEFPTNMWIPKYALPLLGVTPAGKGVLGDHKYYFYNAEETSVPSLFAGEPEDCARRLCIPLSGRGNIMPTGLFERMQAVQKQHKLDKPFWVTHAALKDVGAEPLSDAIPVKSNEATKLPLAFFNASQCTKPEAFTAETCVNYVPRLLPSDTAGTVVPRQIRNTLLAAARHQQYMSQLWIDKDSMEDYNFELQDGLDLEDVLVSVEVPTSYGSPSTESKVMQFVNADCVKDQARANFFETYRPVSQRGKPWAKDWSLLAACAYELGFKHDTWLSVKSLTDRHSENQLITGYTAVDVQLKDEVVELVNAEQTTNPKAVTAFKAAASHRRPYNFGTKSTNFERNVQQH